MKLMGKDITPAKVMAFVGDRLAARGLVGPAEVPVQPEGVEPRVEPLSFNLHALEDNADATRGLPLETHREGVAGRAVVLAKRLFRTAGQIFINEALGRQTVFNGHVRDSYAQLSAEVLRLRQRVAELERDAQQSTVVPLPAPETVSPAVLLETPAHRVTSAPSEKAAPKVATRPARTHKAAAKVPAVSAQPTSAARSQAAKKPRRAK